MLHDCFYSSNIFYPSSAIIKCIFYPLDIFTIDRHYIKAARWFTATISYQKELCCPTDSSLFMPVHCRRRISLTVIAAVFYFHKYQILSVSGNQIDLAAFTVKILCHNKKALFFQKGSRLFFMAAAYSTLIDTQILSLFSYLCVGILCNITDCSVLFRQNV